MQDDKFQLDLLQGFQDFLETAEKAASGRNKRQLLGEKRTLDRIVEELEWKALSDEEKQANRISSIHMSQKWGKMDQADVNTAYPESVVALYDLIDQVLQTIDASSAYKADAFIKRLYALLMIEKLLINEFAIINNIRHNDYYIFTGLLKAHQEHDLYKILNLEKVLNTFIEMYKLWPNAPYDDIE